METLDIVESSIAVAPINFREPASAEMHDQQIRLTLEIKSDVAGLLSLQNEWDDLVHRSLTSIFQSFDWLFSWWKYFGEGRGRRLHILVFRSDGLLVGIAPFYIHLERWKQRKLKTMGGGIPEKRNTYEHYAYYSPSDLMDILAAKSFEAAVGKSVAEHLNAASDLFDSIDFANVPDEGILLRWVLPFVDTSLFRCNVEHADQCPRLTTPESLVNYLASLKPSIRRRLNRARTAFCGESIARMEPILSREEMALALHQLIEMHQKRWNALGYPGMFSDKRFLHFQLELANRLYDKGFLWCKRAQYAGVVIGCRIGYLFQGKVYDYLSGFDPALPGASRGPGLALLLSMIDDAIRDSMQSIEFLRGDEQYKMELTSESIHIWNVTFQSLVFENSLNARFVKGFHIWNMFRHKAHKEMFLARVQLRQHGPAAFIITYVAFFVHRLRSKKPLLMHKLRGMFGHTPGTVRPC